VCVQRRNVSRWYAPLVRFRHTIRQHVYDFADLRTLLGKASPARAADRLAGLAAED
jgi:ethanolamine ammonia-lyase large subunit